MNSDQLLLAIDIGNTNIVMGIFRGATLQMHWRIATEPLRTEDEYAALLAELCALNQLEFQQLEAVAISSVVPPVEPYLIAMSRRYLNQEPLVIQTTANDPMPIRYRNPQEVGADRIVNAYAAWLEYKGPLIIVDFGTATTFCAVSAAGEYLGGTIVPGLYISAEALCTRTAKLPRIQVAKPPHVIGQTTVESMQSGLFYGYLDMTDGLIRRMKQELGGHATVIATGGLAAIFYGESAEITNHEPNLTLKGLYLLYARKKSELTTA